jgi:hypothetical protein
LARFIRYSHSSFDCSKSRWTYTQIIIPSTSIYYLNTSKDKSRADQGSNY